jgi:hypothetical protein
MDNWIANQGNAFGSTLPPMLPMNGGQQLPVWSSTGPIPFGTREVGMSEAQMTTMAVPQIGSIEPPEPAKSENHTAFAPPTTARPDDAMKTEMKQEQDEKSIWDVPETPQR